MNHFKDCKLYEGDVTLVGSCTDENARVFVMYTPGRFTDPRGDSPEKVCLKDEENLVPVIRPQKLIIECAALCDSWFPCRSFRIDQDNGECRLYTEEQHSKDFCPDEAPSGDLFVYYSEFYFVRLTENFCVPSISRIGPILEGIALEACKVICEKNSLCVALEHNQNGDCALYSSSDFSLPCNDDAQRTLYIR